MWKERYYMVITATEFKTNLGKYLELASTEDILITKNGKAIAQLSMPNIERLGLLDNLVGLAEAKFPIDEEDIKNERLSKQ